MITLDVRADVRKVQVFLRALSDKGTKRAISRSLNRTATTVRAEAARLLRTKRLLPITIKKSLKVKNATVNNLTAVVTASGKSISIRNFSRLSFETARIAGARQKVGIRGINVRITQSSRARLLRKFGNKAFTNPRIGGGLPIMVRTSKKRFPIEAWQPVPGLPTVFVQEKIADAMRAVASQTFTKRLEHEIQYEINAAKGKAV